MLEEVPGFTDAEDAAWLAGDDAPAEEPPGRLELAPPRDEDDARVEAPPVTALDGATALLAAPRLEVGAGPLDRLASEEGRAADDPAAAEDAARADEVSAEDDEEPAGSCRPASASPP